MGLTALYILSRCLVALHYGSVLMFCNAFKMYEAQRYVMRIRCSSRNTSEAMFVSIDHREGHNPTTCDSQGMLLCT